MKNNITYLVLILNFFSSFSQTKIKINQVDKIVCGANSFRMFKSIENDKYIEVFLDFDTKKTHFSKPKKITLLKTQKIIDIKSLKPIKHSELLKSKDFTIVNLIFKNNKNLYFLRTDDRNIAVIYKINKEYISDFTSYIGNQPEKKRKRRGCGSSPQVRATRYQLLFNEEHNLYEIMSTFPLHFKKGYLKNIQKTDSISFINGRNYINSYYYDSKYIIVLRNDKFGLFKFDFGDVKNLEYVKDERSYSRRKKRTKLLQIKGKELLQIKYDSIKLENNLVYFYKNKKVAIYPNIKEPIYDEIEPVSKMFWRIHKNGKIGWFYIDRQKEYWN